MQLSATKRGRVPKPTELRVLEGNNGRGLGRRAANKREPKPRLGLKTPPVQLDTRAKAEYRRIVDEMQRAAPKLFTQIDDTALAVFCEAKFQWLDLVAKINADKAAGTAVDRFDVVMAAKWASMMTTNGDRLGLSPAARTRLSMPEFGDGNDDLLG